MILEETEDVTKRRQLQCFLDSSQSFQVYRPIVDPSPAAKHSTSIDKAVAGRHLPSPSFPSQSCAFERQVMEIKKDAI